MEPANVGFPLHTFAVLTDTTIFSQNSARFAVRTGSGTSQAAIGDPQREGLQTPYLIVSFDISDYVIFKALAFTAILRMLKVSRAAGKVPLICAVPIRIPDLQTCFPHR